MNNLYNRYRDVIEAIKENSKLPIDIDYILEDIKRIYERDKKEVDSK